MTTGPLVPVVLKDAAFAPPAAETYYVVAGNGFFLERRTELYTATVAVDGGVPGLRPHEARLDLRLPRKLPRALVECALGFFRAVYDRWDGEGILVMFYAPSDGVRPVRYRLDAPPQKIRGRVERGRFRADLRLDYGACERPDDAWRKLGTFHSHGPCGPRHSSIDAHDELWETGLHLTAGYVGSSLPEFEASFVVNGTRFPIAVDEVLERPRAARPYPKRWLDRIEVIELASTGYADGGYTHAY
jgi:hypothetical protein